MNLSIDLAISSARYRLFLAKVSQPNLLQDPIYGFVYAWFYGLTLRHGAIQIGGETAGIFQWFERKALGGLIHALMLDRGPLWLPGFGQKEQQETFFRHFNRLFPRRLGRRRRVIPELSLADTAEMARWGYRPGHQTSYATYLVDLTVSQQQLRTRLNGKWRNALHKAEQWLERGELKTDWSSSPESIKELLRRHHDDSKSKNYHRAHPVLMKRLLIEYAKAQGLLLGLATYQGELCSAVAMLCHGNVATYQLAWNNQTARQNGANNLLLWQAMLNLQQRGISYFDLGGFNDQAPGLQHFKAGLGGKELRLAGMFS